MAHSVGDTKGGALAALLFVSGVLALVYEVVWQREFALVLGSASSATSAVLAAYFGGLGVGSWLLGRRAGRLQRPLRLYAIIEGLIGASALLVGPGLSAMEGVEPWLIDVAGASAGGAWILRVLFVALAILLPTACMGGTLPLLAKVVDPAKRQLGVSAGWLYVANTAGAALGALSVPFVLLPTLGMRGMTHGAATINFALAIAAWGLDRRVRERNGLTKTREGNGTAAVVGFGGSSALAVFFSGFATFALQVLWNRAFSQVHENSLYSFALIVALVVFALAAGGAIARQGLKRGFSPGALVGLGWLLAGGLVFCGPWALFALTNGLDYLPLTFAENGRTAPAFMAAALVVFTPMLLMGIAVPALMEAASRRDGGPAEILGRLFAVNVLGSVAGALVAGFVFPAWLGLWPAIAWMGVLLAAAGGCAWLTREGASRRGWVVSATVVAAASLLPLRNLDLPRVRVAEGERILSIAEGSHGITAVVERGDSRRIKLNNHYGLGGTASTGDERMQAHLPLLLHPRPRTVAHLGLGTGISAGAVWLHPTVERLTVVELVPEVVAAAKAHFAQENLQVLTHAGTRLVLDDARHHLRTSRETYDLIIGDLVVPWRQGEGALYTLEHFQAAKAALEPGGVFCQWIPLFQVSETEFFILLRTFLEVFPSAQVWRADFSPERPALALVAGAPETTLPQIGLRLAALRPDAENRHLRFPGAIFMYRIGDLTVSEAGVEQRINSENRPWIELIGPKAHAGDDAGNLFVGRNFQRWAETLQDATARRASETENEAWRYSRTGSVFAGMLLDIQAGKQGEVARAQATLRSELPEALYAEFFPASGL